MDGLPETLRDLQTIQQNVDEAKRSRKDTRTLIKELERTLKDAQREKEKVEQEVQVEEYAVARTRAEITKKVKEDTLAETIRNAVANSRLNRSRGKCADTTAAC